MGEASTDNGKAPEAVGQQSLLQTRAVEYSFGMTRALRGIDLDISEGETLAVMGPSGSGKSTLMHVLAGVLVPDVGTVRYRGEDMSSWSEERRANLRLTDFGFVFQFGQLLPDLSALDNVTIPLLLAGIERRKAVPRARDALVAFGLEAELDRLPSKMSGGQAQRVAIARALVAHPRVIFADEPTGSLDSFAAEQVMDALVRRVREDGSTLVLVTHDARTAAYADREVIVRDGRISAGTGSSDSAGSHSTGPCVGGQSDGTPQ
ncbi:MULTISPECIES: ABC transporter ATP-binding protein [unclassified Actinobaculum]|uniref:ABC transporter ATP-binding protein n=1 Tax=unclassified Actinobaculum TaxID=2609299 RepID=UPI000D527C6C|nr:MULTISPECIES: ABC transporter ATP-binding protein [unclassified Actinobaculum]AWE43482.1 ABC transporter ATP-binding protein [Actinobaculum sp. 313]RTE49648.1 ABC transporter ATP-binding protein [Actinobaculum sp. 352]